MTPDLVVWRHGRTAYNNTERFQGHLDTPLDEVGHAQARAAAAVLASYGPARVVTSDLQRAASTADYLGAAAGVEVERDARLREVDVGAWSGLTRTEIAERYPADHAAWMRGEDVRRGGGEVSGEVVERASAAVRDRLPCEGPLVVCTHGGTSRDLVIALLGLPRQARTAFAVLGNAHWAALARHGDGWRLVSYNVAAPAEANADAAVEPVL
jgi:probable phosphoglycerate mutase